MEADPPVTVGSDTAYFPHRLCDQFFEALHQFGGPEVNSPHDADMRPPTYVRILTTTDAAVASVYAHAE